MAEVHFGMEKTLTSLPDLLTLFRNPGTGFRAF